MIDEPSSTESLNLKPKQSKFLLAFGVLFVGGAFLLLCAVLYLLNLNQPPSSAIYPVRVTIEEGESVRSIASKLQDAQVVKSDDLLYLVLVTQFDPTQIKASQYVFETPQTTYDTASKLIAGDFDTDLTSITIFEGESRTKIAERLDGQFAWFDQSEFMQATEGMEGFLFPETYFVPEDFSTTAFVTLLHDSYHVVADEYADELDIHSQNEIDVITLASIVEREANTEESMKLVAGIFKNRLEIGMALQADASIEYVLDEGLHELKPGELAESLREIDSPYNTYLYPGLPPTPIGNPGRTAIEAVLFPTASDYFYYITGTNGEFYYAETYNQHLRNIDAHLR